MIHVLLRRHNEYYQFGEYFVGAWDHKPSGEEIMKAINSCEDNPKRSLNDCLFLSAHAFDPLNGDDKSVVYSIIEVNYNVGKTNTNTNHD